VVRIRHYSGSCRSDDFRMFLDDISVGFLGKFKHQTLVMSGLRYKLDTSRYCWHYYYWKVIYKLKEMLWFILCVLHLHICI